MDGRLRRRRPRRCLILFLFPGDDDDQKVLALLMAAVALLVTSAAPGAQSPDHAKLLGQIKAADKGQLAVSEEDGRFLRLLIASSGSKRVLEIGGASGYSAIWMGMALRDTGGRLVTIEYDPIRAKELTANIQKAVSPTSSRSFPGRVPADSEAAGHV